MLARAVQDQTRTAIDAIRKRTSLRPVCGIVLGSGLGGLADDVHAATRVPYTEIPGWERSTVSSISCG